MLSTLQPTLNSKRLLGEVLLDGEFISHDDLSAALEHQRDTNERLGEILCRLGVLSPMELKAVLAAQADLDAPDAKESADGVRHRLGDLLLKAKRVSPRQLDRALEEQQKTNEKLGEVLLRFNLITGPELDAILSWQQDASGNSATAVKLMLGEILVATDIISRHQLKHALEQQKLTRKQIGEILIDTGMVKPNQITQALKIQSKLFTATLVAVLAAGALTGCGAMAPGVPGSIDQTGLKNGSVLEYTVSTPAAHIQSADREHEVTVYQNGAHVIDNVPYVEQNANDNTCAQAASTVLLKYWGVNIEYQQVVNEANRFNLGTTSGSASSYLKSKGLNVQPYRNGTIDFLKSLIDKGHPAMVCLDYSGAEHWIVVVGYNDSTGRVIVHDSIGGPFQTMTYEKFKSRWQNKTLAGMPIVGGANWNGLIFDTSK